MGSEARRALTFFAVLLPGAVATWLLLQYLPADAKGAFHVGASEPTSVQWVLYLLTSYGLGHFVFMGGSKLDTGFDRWRKRNKSGETDVAYRLSPGPLDELS